MGPSKREAATSRMGEALKQQRLNIGDTNFNVDNRFDDPSAIPFNYNDMTGQLDKGFNMDVGNINRIARTDENLAELKRGGALKSQGINSGSQFNEMVSAAASPVRMQKYNTIKDLAARKQGQNVNLMKTANRDEITRRRLATDVDNQNIYNLLRKFGLLQGNLNAAAANNQNFSDDTWFDDALAVGNTVGGFL